MIITDEMVDEAVKSLALVDFPDCDFPGDWSADELLSFARMARAALYAAAPFIRAAAIEEAAKVAETFADNRGYTSDRYTYGAETGDGIAAAIRSLKDKP